MEKLSKRTRIFNLLEGKAIDRTPAGFWLHFPEEMHHGEKAIEAHLRFVKETDTDILKIMNENLLYDGSSKIAKLSDISKFRSYDRTDKLFIDQSDIISRISERAKGDYPIVATIHGLIASVFHATGFAGYYASMGYMLALFCRERPAEMHGVMRMYTDTLARLIDCSLESGADGIFYAALGGERQFFTDEEFAEFVLPYEKELYAHIKSRAKLDILHVCKSNINLERYTSLNPTIVNWGIYQNGISLTDGARIFPDSILLGGFQDRSGVLVDGSEAQITAHTEQVLAEMKGRRFIVGSDCTLPTEITSDRIRSVVRAIEHAEA